MALLTNMAVFLLLACFHHQMMLGNSQPSIRQRTGDHKSQLKGRPGLKEGIKLTSVSVKPIKLVSRDKSECTWTAAGDDLVYLNVTCVKRSRSSRCWYTGRPSVCPQYASNKELYWKQISRGLKKQKILCEDGGVLVKAGMCRGAASDTHFKLHKVQRSTSPHRRHSAARNVKSCQFENKKLAEEFCGDSWSSLCTFLFTMVKDYDC